ncbi:hypothetical protein MMC29_002722 [Sticta canariensis]|nr:hypothetical protein [Sticta canariensis]
MANHVPGPGSNAMLESYTALRECLRRISDRQSMENPETLPSADTDALRGAQGLLAGMTLLNELEPLENVDGISDRSEIVVS